MFPTQPGKRSSNRRARANAAFERRLLVSVLLIGLPGSVFTILLLWTNSYSIDHRLEGTALVLILWISLSISARSLVVNSIRVLSNVVAALKEEDFSFRASDVRRGDVLGELAIEINNLAQALETERMGSIETVILLRQVMAAAGAAIMAFSPQGKLLLVNREAAVLLGRNEDYVVNRYAEEFGIASLCEGPASEILSLAFLGTERRWIIRRTHFRLHGVSHLLMVLSEASEALRAEERLAWQRLVRVLSHEINNSLATIKSIARTLSRVLGSPNLAAPSGEEFKHGLDIIGDRAESLDLFLQSYAALAKLPAPVPASVDLQTVMNRVVRFESNLPVRVVSGPFVRVYIDEVQVEQGLINLVKNAVDAVFLKGNNPGINAVTISWNVVGTRLEIWLRDEGVGLSETENLFVPFYTTKQKGSGIGLILSRQIFEGHGGSLTLQNRRDRSGCEVHISIPDCVLPQRDTRAAEEPHHHP